MSNVSGYILALLMMPPPVHGASAINLKMVQFLKSNGVPVTTLNTVPSRFSNLFNSRRWKFFRLLLISKIFIQILSRFRNRPSSVYFGISGGTGLFFDCILAIAIRLIHAPVFVHHHSFAYLQERSLLFELLCKILCPSKTTHIVLCDEMGDLICESYPLLVSKDRLLKLSNAAFSIASENMPTTTEFRNALRVGYISNITPEKGIDDVFNLFNLCQKSNLLIKMIVAGPCQSTSIKDRLNRLSENSSDFSYLGPVYGDEKLAFFRSLDVLIFPTRYENEAEPLVIYEAAEQGVPTIANARGCISTMVAHCGGWSVAQGSSFLEESLSVLSDLANSDLRTKRCELALAGCDYLRGSSTDALNSLLDKLRRAHESTS